MGQRLWLLSKVPQKILKAARTSSSMAFNGAPWDKRDNDLKLSLQQ